MPESAGGNYHLEPCPFPENTCLGNGYAGDPQDLAGEIKTKTGVPAISFIEENWFVMFSNSGTIIFEDQHQPLIFRSGRDADSCHLLTPVSQGVIDEIVEYLLNERIGKNLKTLRFITDADISHRQPGNRPANNGCHILP